MMKKSGEVMNSTERRNEIMKILKKKEIINVGDLATQLGVTKVTIRTDLDFLAKQNLIVRTFGGAVISHKKEMIRLVSNVLNEFTSEKEKIAHAASKMVESGMHIIIDTGSTTFRLAKYVKDMPVNIITNSLLVAAEINSDTVADLFLVGGSLSKYCMGFVGKIARADIDTIHANILFLGTAGCSIEENLLTCSTIEEADIKKTMIKNASKVCLLTDSSKFGSKSFAKVCSLELIDCIITNEIDEKSRKILEQKNIEIIIV